MLFCEIIFSYLYTFFVCSKFSIWDLFFVQLKLNHCLMPFGHLWFSNIKSVLTHINRKTCLQSVLTETRNDLKPPETTWNQLKPHGNYLKPPETSLKFGTGVHCYVLITILNLVFQNFCHSCFSGRFSLDCSNWLKFRRRKHCYMLITVLMFIFSKFFLIIFFEQIWSQNLKFFKLTEIWYRGRLLYAYFDYNVYFF